jgi:NAD(P)-dependent dehydrogenase (short-subunit alcohol dehydrogenase family)
MSRLGGKYALITGASRGLGREIALAYAREGAAGLVLVARDARALEGVRERIREVSPETRVLVSVADVRDPSAIERVVATTLSAFDGRLDVLVNNASALGPTPMPYLIDYPLDDFRAVIETNLVAPFLFIKKLLPALLDGGSIVNVTSDAGSTGYPGWGAYGISKFGLEGLSQTWAAELAETDVRVNWVDPGSMDTAMHRAAEPDEDPGEWADPAEVVDIFVYLASDESKHLSGRRLRAQDDWWADATTSAVS